MTIYCHWLHSPEAFEQLAMLIYLELGVESP